MNSNTTTINEISKQVTSKIQVSNLGLETYISTDNMLPNLGGIEKASGMPSIDKAKEFKCGDILFSNIRTYFKKVWYANFDGGCSNDVLVFRGNNRVDSRFLYYVLADNNFIDYTVKTSKGTKMPRGDKDAILKYSLNLPPLSEQKDIAHILGTLDNKIELNRQMNQTLEAMAQALFKSWFVDFDPVIDNAIQAGNDIPEELQARADKRKGLSDSKKLISTNPSLAALFPSSFVFNETLGKWIPEGWEVKSLYDRAEFINGASFKSEYFTNKDIGKPIIKILELKNGVTDQTKFTSQEMPPKYSVNKGDLLYSWSGSPDTSLNAFLWSGEDGWLNQHVFNVVTKNESHKAYCYCLLNELKPILIAIAKDKQTTGLGHITVKDMKNLYVVQPTTAFNELVKNSIGPIFKKVFQLQLENITLTQLRDRLLPELISGRVRVKGH